MYIFKFFVYTYVTKIAMLHKGEITFIIHIVHKSMRHRCRIIGFTDSIYY